MPNTKFDSGHCSKDSERGEMKHNDEMGLLQKKLSFFQNEAAQEKKMRKALEEKVDFLAQQLQQEMVIQEPATHPDEIEKMVNLLIQKFAEDQENLKNSDQIGDVEYKVSENRKLFGLLLKQTMLFYKKKQPVAGFVELMKGLIVRNIYY